MATFMTCAFLSSPATSFSVFALSDAGLPFWKHWEAWLFLTVALLLTGILLYIRLTRQLQAERIVNYFATSLYGNNTVEDVFWDIAKNCIAKLGFEDCVIYLYDDKKEVLVQKAAYGPKNPVKHEILNPIIIPLGKGITGHAALLGKAILVGDTTKDDRYILDDQRRYSELSIPIFVDGKVFGIIDTESSQKNFYTQRHLEILERIAGLCSDKLARYLTEEKIRTSLARDLHDEMGSTLTSINILSKIAIEQQEGPRAYEYLQRIRDNSRRMMDAMGDIVWAVHPENDTLPKMIVRLKEFAAEILEPSGISYHFETDQLTEEIRLNLNTRKELYLILKEAITNAAKYSRAGRVDIGFRVIPAGLEVTVQDNGKGMDPAAATRGNGLKNMVARAEKLQAVLRINSVVGSGTIITVRTSLT